MSTVQPVGQPLENQLKDIPPDRMSPGARAKMVELCRAFDQIARVNDKTGEVFFDEGQLQTLVGTYSSSEFTNQFMMRAKSASSPHVRKSGSNETVTPLTWPAFIARVAHPVPPGDTLKGLGLSPTSSDEEIRKVLEQHFPQTPATLFDPTTAAQLYTKILGRSPQTADQSPASSTDESIASPAGVNTGCFWYCMDQTQGLWIACACLGFIIGFVGGGLIGALFGFALGWGIGVALAAVGCLLKCTL